MTSDNRPLQNLPPKPDPLTGEPRPPHAPIYHGDDKDNEESREQNPRNKPSPPPEQGPVLAWYQSSKRNSVSVAFASFVVIFLGICIVVWLKGGGFFGWMQYWPMWLVVLVPPVLVALTVRGKKCAAGADWLQKGKNWVLLYELTQISLRRYSHDVELHLTDSNDQKVEVETELLQQDRFMWDLVYNGILHSVANGAILNQGAREALQLPEWAEWDPKYRDQPPD